MDSRANDAEGRQAGEILVVGGYGDVGARVSKCLARRFPGRILIGGRRPAAAESVADRIGYGTRAVQIDIGDPASVTAALDGVETAAVCLDDPRTDLTAGAARRIDGPTEVVVGCAPESLRRVWLPGLGHGDCSRPPLD